MVATALKGTIGVFLPTGTDFGVFHVSRTVMGCSGNSGIEHWYRNMVPEGSATADPAFPDPMPPVTATVVKTTPAAIRTREVIDSPRSTCRFFKLARWSPVHRSFRMHTVELTTLSRNLSNICHLRPLGNSTGSG